MSSEMSTQLSEVEAGESGSDSSGMKDHMASYDPPCAATYSTTYRVDVDESALRLIDTRNQ